MLVRPYGKEANLPDQLICGVGKPMARQERDTAELFFTLINLSGVTINFGGTA
jgi:hypothetical protein